MPAYTCFLVQHLRLLRHPNILKFLSCELSRDCITMATEPVIPLNQLLEKMCMEGLVMGWRGVAQGLIFLHDKVWELMVVNSNMFRTRRCSDSLNIWISTIWILHVRQNYEYYSWGWWQITEVTFYRICFQLLLCTREQECMKTGLPCTREDGYNIWLCLSFTLCSLWSRLAYHTTVWVVSVCTWALWTANGRLGALRLPLSTRGSTPRWGVLVGNTREYKLCSACVCALKFSNGQIRYTFTYSTQNEKIRSEWGVKGSQSACLLGWGRCSQSGFIISDVLFFFAL